MVVHAGNPSTEDAEMSGALDSLTRHPRLLSQLQLSERPCLKTGGGGGQRESKTAEWVNVFVKQALTWSPELGPWKPYRIGRRKRIPGGVS